MSTVAIIVAAGAGKRFGSPLPKQFIKLNVKPVLAYTIEKFERCHAIDEIIVVVPSDYLSYVKKEIVAFYSFTKVKEVVAGGSSRQSSVANGLKATEEDADIAVIHDGARPFVTSNDIERVVKCAKEEHACILGVKAKNTIKRSDKSGLVIETLNRDELFEIQTPQAFRRKLILDAFKKAEEDDFISTDDSSLVERLGASVKIIAGRHDNIKITTKEDLLFAEMMLGIRTKVGLDQ